MHLGASNRPGQRRRRTFHECRRRLVEVAITVLIVGHSIANDAVNQILSRGALIRIPEEFLLIEQICLVGL